MVTLFIEVINVISNSLLFLNHGLRHSFLMRTSKVLLIQLLLHTLLFLIEFGSRDAW